MVRENGESARLMRSRYLTWSFVLFSSRYRWRGGYRSNRNRCRYDRWISFFSAIPLEKPWKRTTSHHSLSLSLSFVHTFFPSMPFFLLSADSSILTFLFFLSSHSPLTPGFTSLGKKNERLDHRHRRTGSMIREKRPRAITRRSTREAECREYRTENLAPTSRTHWSTPWSSRRAITLQNIQA